MAKDEPKQLKSSIERVYEETDIHLNRSITDNGITSKAEQTINKMYYTIPNEYKRGFEGDWGKLIKQKIPKKLIGTDDGIEQKAERFYNKVQIVSNIYATNGWFFESSKHRTGELTKILDQMGDNDECDPV